MSEPVKYTGNNSRRIMVNRNGESSYDLHKSVTAPCDFHLNLPTKNDIECHISGDLSSVACPSGMNQQTVLVTDNQQYESSNDSSATDYPRDASVSSQFDSLPGSNQQCLTWNAFPTLCTPLKQSISIESLSINDSEFNLSLDSQPVMIEPRSTISAFDYDSSNSTPAFFTSNVDRSLIHIAEESSMEEAEKDQTKEAFILTGSVEHIRGWSLEKIESELVQFKAKADVERANLVIQGELIEEELEELYKYIIHTFK